MLLFHKMLRERFLFAIFGFLWYSILRRFQLSGFVNGRSEKAALGPPRCITERAALRFSYSAPFSLASQHATQKKTEAVNLR